MQYCNQFFVSKLFALEMEKYDYIYKSPDVVMKVTESLSMFVLQRGTVAKYLQ